MTKYTVQYTDTLSGEANYAWERRASIAMPELTHYGYTGSADGSYAKANRLYERQLMRKAKAAVGITGARGKKENYGGMLAFVPYRSCTILFITAEG